MILSNLKLNSHQIFKVRWLFIFLSMVVVFIPNQVYSQKLGFGVEYIKSSDISINNSGPFYEEFPGTESGINLAFFYTSSSKLTPFIKIGFVNREREKRMFVPEEYYSIFRITTATDDVFPILSLGSDLYTKKITNNISLSSSFFLSIMHNYDRDSSMVEIGYPIGFSSQQPYIKLKSQHVYRNVNSLFANLWVSLNFGKSFFASASYRRALRQRYYYTSSVITVNEEVISVEESVNNGGAWQFGLGFHFGKQKSK